MMPTIKWLSLFIFLISISNVKAVEKIQFELNGLKIGDTLSEEFENKYCIKDEAYKKEERECQRDLKIGGIDVVATYLFYERSLIAISLSYDSKVYQKLVKVYSSKFSRIPHENTREAIDLGTGEKFTNEKVFWKTASGKFFIEKYGNNLKRGYAYLESPEYIEYLDKKKNAASEGIFRNIFRDLFK